MYKKSKFIQYLQSKSSDTIYRSSPIKCPSPEKIQVRFKKNKKASQVKRRIEEEKESDRIDKGVENEIFNCS